MKKLMLAATLGLMSVNCAAVTSGQPTTQSVNGDAWYTKDNRILFLTTGTDVFFCPKESPGKCVKAEFKD
jgi:hypothetical protein